MPILSDENRYQILKLLDKNSDLNQREIARELGLSLGKINYCLKALVEKGLIKASNFKNNKNKLSYSYLLTVKGIEEKGIVTLRFLERKQREYANLEKEIEALRMETNSFEVNP